MSEWRLPPPGSAGQAELAEGLGSSGWPARATGSGRHDSLEACLDWSHALLPADAAVVFRRLSVFPGGFDLAGARGVAGAPPVGPGRVGVLVELLVTASLLEADTSGTRTRFRFHEPVRQYAAARLAGAGEEDLARWRHARAFLARAEAIEPLRSGGFWTRNVPPRFSKRAWKRPAGAAMTGPAAPGWPGWAGPVTSPDVSTLRPGRCGRRSS